MDELNKLRQGATEAKNQAEMDRLYGELSTWCCGTANFILGISKYHYH